jgi:dihydroxyacid dehydratase/phosphogluconate dehydratase
VRNGDIVELNVPQRKLHLHISNEELAKRMAAWKKPEPPLSRGWTWTSWSASAGRLFHATSIEGRGPAELRPHRERRA